MIKVFLKSHKA